MSDAEVEDVDQDQSQPTKDHEEIDVLELRFDYIKSNCFRVLHVDGAWGGITPNGLLNMVLFSERNPIPKQTTHYVRPGEPLKEDPEQRIAREVDAVRELEVAAIMRPNVARQLRDWLTEKLKEWDNAKSKIDDLRKQ